MSDFILSKFQWINTFVRCQTLKEFDPLLIQGRENHENMFLKLKKNEIIKNNC